MATQKNLLFCFCGPSASGKSTLCTKLLTKLEKLQLSVSTTTRSPRGSERDGVDYYFVDKEEFARRIASNCFIEHAEYGGNSYGTEKRNIADAESAGNDLLFDIEVQGVQQLKTLYPTQVVTIFVFPPSFSKLRERFAARGANTEEEIEKRMTIARKEIEVLTGDGFSDYLIVNDDLERSIALAESIIHAERARFSRLDKGYVRALCDAK